MVLVPSVMALLGARARWMPRWLGRVVPQLRIEGSAAVPEDGAGPAVPGSAADVASRAANGEAAAAPALAASGDGYLGAIPHPAQPAGSADPAALAPGRQGGEPSDTDR
jgi:putative drug exporter of the RND superfamily